MDTRHGGEQQYDKPAESLRNIWTWMPYRIEAASPKEKGEEKPDDVIYSWNRYCWEMRGAVLKLIQEELGPYRLTEA